MLGGGERKNLKYHNFMINDIKNQAENLFLFLTKNQRHKNENHPPAEYPFNDCCECHSSEPSDKR